MEVRTGVRAKPAHVYRVIGRDLWAAATNRPLAEQHYELVKEAVANADRDWQVSIRSGDIWLVG